MNLFQVSVAASTLLFVSQTYAIDCYNLDQKSVAYQTCMLRKENDDRDYRLRKEREEREKKEASDRSIDRLIKEAKEKEREAKEKSDKYWENVKKEQKARKATEQHQKEQESQEAADGLSEMADELSEAAKRAPPNEKKMLQVMISGMSELAALRNLPYFNRVQELRESGQCKEAHDLIKKKSRGGDKIARNAAEILHAGVSKGCDKDSKASDAYLLHAAQNGSMAAMFIIESEAKK